MDGSRFLSSLACAAAAIALAACNQPANEPPGTNAVPGATAPAGAAAPLTGEAQIERGRMLVIGGGCHDCHTPKKLGPNGPEFARTMSGWASAKAPFTRRPAFEPGSTTDSVASPALEVTVAAIDAS